MEKGLCDYCNKLVTSIGYQGVFHVASTENHFDCARTLLRAKKADANKEHNGAFPLHDTVASGNVEGVHFLLTEAKANVNKRSGLFSALSTLTFHARYISTTNYIAIMLIEHGIPFVVGMDYPAFFHQYRAQLAACRMAQRSLERVLKKTKVVCKDLVPWIVDMVWETRANQQWTNQTNI